MSAPPPNGSAGPISVDARDLQRNESFPSVGGVQANLPPPILPDSLENSILDGQSDDYYTLDSDVGPRIPFTPRGAVILVQQKFQPGSIKSSIFTLVCAIVGCGVLSLPYGFRQVGLVFGILCIAICSLLAYFSLSLLVVTSGYISHHPSYEQLSLAASGKGLALFTQICLLITLMGVIISYIVAAASVFDLVIGVVFNIDSVYQYAVIAVALVIVLPLSLMKTMAALRFSSLYGICCTTYLTLIIVVEYILLCDDHKTCFWRNDFHLTSKQIFNTDIKGIMTGVPLFVFSYTCHPNLLSIYLELQRRSSRRMHKVIRRALGSAVLLYLVAGIFSYLTFLDDTCSNILINKFHKHPQMIVGALLVGFSVTMTCPILMFAFRESFFQLFYGKNQLNTMPHALWTTLFVIIGASVAAFVTDLSIVFAFLGSFPVPVIIFWLPTIFMSNIVPKDKYVTRKRVAWVICVVMEIICFSCGVYNLYAIITGTRDSKCDSAQDIG